MKTGKTAAKPMGITMGRKTSGIELDRGDYTCPEDGCTFKVKGLPPEARSVLAELHFKEKHGG